MILMVVGKIDDDFWKRTFGTLAVVLFLWRNSFASVLIEEGGGKQCECTVGQKSKENYTKNAENRDTKSILVPNNVLFKLQNSRNT